MSKWTWDKIKSQIKRGDTFDYEEYKDELIVKVEEFGVRFFDTDYNGLNGYNGTQKWENFRFYRNGIEILPELEREVIKFTEKLVDGTPRFLTDQNEFVRIVGKLKLSRQHGDRLIEEVPNARVLYRYADTLEISHWGEK